MVMGWTETLLYSELSSMQRSVYSHRYYQMANTFLIRVPISCIFYCKGKIYTFSFLSQD